MSDSRRVCVCPGSYDPVTLGHLDVIERAAAMFDDVVVAVLHNPDKRGTFTAAERVELLRHVLEGRERVRVVEFGGRLLVDVCRELGAAHVVKGLRGGADFDYELPMALMNRHLTGVETVFVAADPRLAHVSSSLVRQVNAYGGDVSGLVPDVVRDALVAHRRA
ncbi:pantetheine-phosphate adenylyltransferase [Angustibacter sp. Root456]|uniref:pantetheine-phosphate adenylyltransferase n=1 Tax=Angustibacter sp. Root456 TaxID=1736539 RepID=UPI0006F6B417|nr:pantetheine-phosphate adenylyltransferase [Angustibacter sp. Root456]KQX69572.1 phosphopantetheine adenylyltransferase [Angustibacter sp. Root456]